MKRVAAYCRVSTEHSDQANSFSSQQRFFRQYIEARPDWMLTEIFADAGITGTSTKKRTQFNRMLEAARRGAFDLIVTKEISRFARNTLDSIYYTRELRRYGVGVLFLNDGINTLDADAELRLAILSSIAQEESRRTSQRVKWGQQRRMEQGVVFGRSLLGYDVSGGTMTVNEAGAAVVRRIFRKYVTEGKGTHTIARELLEEGILPRNSTRWSSSVILRILRNEKYCGDLVQKKTYTPDYLTHEKKYNHGQETLVVLREHHEAIIPRPVFEEAQRMLSQKAAQRGKPRPREPDPLSGLLRCGLCGGICTARSRTRQDGSRRKTWRCLQARKYGKPHRDAAGNLLGCEGASVPQEELLELIQRVIRSVPLDREETETHLLRLFRKQSIRPSASCKRTLEGLLCCPAENPAFCCLLLDKVVIHSRDRVSVYLKGLSEPWCFA